MDLAALDVTTLSTQELLEAARNILESDPPQAIKLANKALCGADALKSARAYLIIGTASYLQGQLDEALLFLAKANNNLVHSTHTAEALEAALLLGRIHRDLSHFGKAAEQFEAALELAKQTNNSRAEVDALNLLAGIYSTQGEHPRALELLGYALDLARALDLWEKQANILSNIGALSILLGNYPQALESLKAAYELFQEMGPGTRGQATNLISLGHLYQEMGNCSEAQAFYLHAREVGRKALDLLIEAAALNSLANLDLSAGDWVSARESFQEALEIARRVGSKQYEIDNLDGLGQVYVALENFKRAAEVHLTTLAVAQEIGDPEGEIDALLNLGKDYIAMAKADEALEPCSRGLALAQQLGRQRLVFEAHKLLSQAFKHTGNFSQALHHFEAFHRVEKSIFNEENEQKTRKLTVQFEVERARHEAEEYRLRTEVMKQARDEAEAAVRNRTRELEEAQLEIVNRLAVAAEYRDDDTGEHTKRVGRNAAAIAYILGWPEDKVQLLFVAARLHDVGKIGIRDAILHKPGSLDPDEMNLMRMHTMIGTRILAGGHSPLLVMAEEIALAHHERWDGKGYPLGLAGEAIPIAARIVAVADVLDALTHERPYKRAWPISDALAEIQRQSAHHFDPLVVDACMRAFGSASILCPTDAASDWQSTISELQRLPLESVGRHQIQAAPGLDGKKRLEKLLLEETRELGAAMSSAF